MSPREAAFRWRRGERKNIERAREMFVRRVSNARRRESDARHSATCPLRHAFARFHERGEPIKRGPIFAMRNFPLSDILLLRDWKFVSFASNSLFEVRDAWEESRLVFDATALSVNARSLRQCSSRSNELINWFSRTKLSSGIRAMIESLLS